MNIHLFNFKVSPSVVRADVPTKVTVTPLGENVSFKAGEVYSIQVYDVETACSYYNALPHATYEVMAEADGCLRFTHMFAGEQKHILKIVRPEAERKTMHYDITRRVTNPDNFAPVLAVYSLREDFYGLRPYKCDLHCHTCESDGKLDVAATVGNYRAAGYDFLAITDHYIMMSSEKAIRLFENAPVGMRLLCGEEVHLPTERIHAVAIGGERSVNEDFRNRREEIQKEVEALIPTLAIPEEVNAEDYAWRVWIARRAHEFGALSVLAHPHWIWNDVFFIAEPMTEALLKAGEYDALEILNEREDPSVNAEQWNELRIRGYHIPVVGVSDSHNSLSKDPANPVVSYTMVLARGKTFEDLKEAIKAERSAAVYNAYEQNFVYSNYRMVKYIQFILDYYMPYHQRLCLPEGDLLREYGEGKCKEVEELLRLHDARVTAFEEEFFGGM